MGLTAAERAFYDENGYVLKRGLIAPAAISQIEREIAGLHERLAAKMPEGVGISWEEFEDGRVPERIRQLMHSEVVSEGLNRALRCDAMLDIIEALIGPDISLYHSKLLMKAARDGTAIPWHQDYAYWKREDNAPLMVNCQLAIDRADDENGCIQFIPGSHEWGLQEHERAQTSFGVFLPGHYRQRDDAVPVPMAPGDGVFFSALTIHGSGPNSSPRDRRMNTFAYNVTGNSEGQCREWLRGRVLP